MESYLEVSFINSCLILYVSVMVAQYASWQPIAKKYCLLYALIVSFVGVFFWFPYAMLMVVIIEVLFFLFIFRRAYKTYLFSMCFRFLCIATCFLLYGGGFHNFIWFVPLQATIWVTWLLYIFALVLLHCKWKDYVAKLSCVYDVSIYTKTKTLHVVGYLDSGNLLTYEGKPVVFIDCQYKTYFAQERIELIVMNTIAQTEVIRCYQCDIQLHGCKRHRVYIHCDKTLQLPVKCGLLLNMKVMTLG